MKRNKLADLIADSLEISRDIVSEQPRLVITGGGVITIEGFLGLAEYTEEKTVVKTKVGVVVIAGCGLRIDEITEERIVLKGEVESVNLL